MTQALGDDLARVLGDHNSILLRGHGAMVVSDDLDELVRLGINLVKNVCIQIMASVLGAPKAHSEAESRLIVELETQGNALRRFIDYYVSEAVISRYLF